eukprot:TRINITY_DN24148_c0_g1_i1.p1 TRINITY_DN24148_c0_g1~~TRINITY_DN24148_c0_g1_i1.p1  ORF type:complete len:563 (+),score=61.66 TRINITY_DN24148_c0_g1_i1:172-1860(+)
MGTFSAASPLDDYLVSVGFGDIVESDDARDVATTKFCFADGVRNLWRWVKSWRESQSGSRDKFVAALSTSVATELQAAFASHDLIIAPHSLGHTSADLLLAPSWHSMFMKRTMVGITCTVGTCGAVLFCVRAFGRQHKVAPLVALACGLGVWQVVDLVSTVKVVMLWRRLSFAASLVAVSLDTFWSSMAKGMEWLRGSEGDCLGASRLTVIAAIEGLRDSLLNASGQRWRLPEPATHNPDARLRALLLDVWELQNEGLSRAVSLTSRADASNALQLLHRSVEGAFGAASAVDREVRYASAVKHMSESSCIDIGYRLAAEKLRVASPRLGTAICLALWRLHLGFSVCSTDTTSYLHALDQLESTMDVIEDMFEPSCLLPDGKPACPSADAGSVSGANAAEPSAGNIACDFNVASQGETVKIPLDVTVVHEASGRVFSEVGGAMPADDASARRGRADAFSDCLRELRTVMRIENHRTTRAVGKRAANVDEAGPCMLEACGDGPDPEDHLRDLRIAMRRKRPVGAAADFLNALEGQLASRRSPNVYVDTSDTAGSNVINGDTIFD